MLSGALATTESVWQGKKVGCPEESDGKNAFFQASFIHWLWSNEDWVSRLEE
jgi:hypothetical protein